MSSCIQPNESIPPRRQCSVTSCRGFARNATRRRRCSISAPRRAALDRRRVDRQHVALVHDRGIVTEILRRAVVVEKAVSLPLDIVQLGVDVAGELAVPAQFVGQKLKRPARIDIAIERADAAVFAGDQRLRILLKPGR